MLIKADDMAHSMRLGKNLFSVERAYYLAVCFDAGTGEILWQEEIPCTLPATDKKRIYKTEYRNASGSLAQGLMAAVGNQAVLLNAENGEKAAGYDTLCTELGREYVEEHIRRAKDKKAAHRTKPARKSYMDNIAI